VGGGFHRGARRLHRPWSRPERRKRRTGNQQNAARNSAPTGAARRARQFEVSGIARPIWSRGRPRPAWTGARAAHDTGQPIDGIQCSGGEQIASHIHIHLTVFVNGVAQEVPAAVGIADPPAQPTPEGPFIGAGSCFYWLHTHAADGIIHVESPITTTYHLGQFFDIWGESLGADNVGPAKGPVTAFYDGQQWTGDPRNIPLNAHSQIQLDVGSPLVAPESIRFPNGL